MPVNVMPVINRYQNEPGYYIRARVEDGVITYQTTPKADRLFNELGLTDGSSISWRMLRDLDQRGDIYTGGSGIDLPEYSDMSLDLSNKEKRIYERYLSDESSFENLERINNIVNDFFDDRSDFDSTTKRSDLRKSVYEKLIEKGNPNLLTSLKAFNSQPYKISNIEIEGSEVLFEFSVSNSIQLSCRDLRWTSKSSDFEGFVNYDKIDNSSTSFSVRDGYFINWNTPSASSDTTQPVEDRHISAYRADYGKRSGLGFDKKNWTEVVRRCFLYVDRYDIIPDEKGGHKGLCSFSELAGKDVWLHAHSTKKSSSKGGPGEFVITNEMRDIQLPDVNEIGWHFIRLDNQSSKSWGGNDVLIGRSISLLTGD